MLKSIKFILIFLSIFSFQFVHGKQISKIDDISFNNTPLTQVLKTLSEIFEVTIVPDKSVEGNVTRFFKNTSLEEMLSLLLLPLGYEYHKTNTIYFVSKKRPFTIEYDNNSKLITIEAKKAKLQDIINTLSMKTKFTITMQEDINDIVTINLYNKNLEETLSLLTKSLNYQIIKEKQNYLIKKNQGTLPFSIENKINKKHLIINGDENNISIKLYNQDTKKLILILFNKFNKELNLLSSATTTIPFIEIKKIDFNSLLSIILEHSGQAFTIKDNRYYIYDSIIKKQRNGYLSTKIYKLQNIDFKRLSTIVPQQILSPSSYKYDPQSNSILLFGSPKQVEDNYNEIKKIDEAQSNFKLHLFKLKSINVKNIKNYLPRKYREYDITLFEDKNIFSIVITNKDAEELSSFLAKIDKPKIKFIYKFKYLDPQKVIKSFLPKEIKRENCIVNNNDSSVSFLIDKEKKDFYTKYFDSIDVAPIVIRYQLLIVEYIHSNDFKWDWSMGFKEGGKPWFSGEAGIFDNNDTIHANIDFPTVFGHYFTMKFEHKLYEQKAKIQMATEIYGISGESVSLSNTQTLQYKDYQTDLEGKTSTPIYSSTTFGLNFQIKGRATSNDEVFIEVSASISDQIEGSPGSSAPNTTEKSVKNAIRTKTGKPIILGGLKNKKRTFKQNKFPLLSLIPYLGNAFKTHDNKYTDSEFVIYIIPFIQKSEDDLKRERRKKIKDMYDFFVRSRNEEF